LVKQGVKKDLPFGSYKWRVLTVKDSTALLVAEEIVKKTEYNNSHASTTWENCSLRLYLNNEFYNEFGVKEKALIVSSRILNLSNIDYETAGGNATNDNVFLLSIAEANRYFTDDADRVANYNGSADWWWLRSPGGDNQYAAGVEGRGKIGIGGNRLDSIHGVRPALYIKL